ncbi:hypothetical protein [Rhizobium phage RHph_N46]|nr:hypothetical protein [Rhizobium phage RHph_N46]
MTKSKLVETRTIRFYHSAERAQRYANRMSEEALKRSDTYFSVITVTTPEALAVGIARFQNHECNLLLIVGQSLMHGWNIRDADDVTIEFDDEFPDDAGLRNQAKARLYRPINAPSTITKQ